MKKLFNRKILSSQKQIGFSLLEVMIALVVSNVALLGLVAGELKSLQYANNSFQYTVSLIHANNTVERVLNDVCKLKSGDETFDQTYVSTRLSSGDNKYSVSLGGINNPLDNGNVFYESFTVSVDWVDARMTDQNLNHVAVMANFPTVSSGCSVL